MSGITQAKYTLIGPKYSNNHSLEKWPKNTQSLGTQGK
jgi:hypothetical protein